MTDELCLFVLSLVKDGRTLHPTLVTRAQGWAETHPSCQQALGDFAALSEVFRTEPELKASEGFTESVLRKQRREQRQGAQILPLLRRLSMAAAVLLGLTVAFDLGFPGGAAADDELEAHVHLMDSLRPDPFGGASKADALRAGLDALLPDPSPRGLGTDAAPEQAEAADR